jgi:hypothetical protein
MPQGTEWGQSAGNLFLSMKQLDVSTDVQDWERALREMPEDAQYRFLETLGAAYQTQIGVVFTGDRKGTPQRLNATAPILHE